jgi:wobble nucleotide-excising tRNase
MIDRIIVHGPATFSAASIISDLSDFNFAYGTNGSGKTTISRVIADPAEFASCTVSWKDGIELKRIVYNRDFVDSHFYQEKALPGIFTLGEEAQDTKVQIENAATKIAELSSDREKLRGTLQAKQLNLGSADEALAGACWILKKTHDDKFQVAFTGCRQSQQQFKQKVLSERDTNTADLQSLSDLESAAKKIFGATPAVVPIISSIDSTALADLEDDSILKKKIVGKSDVDIATLIQRLGNSDWVKTGRQYLEVSDGACPFCQQEVPATFEEELGRYFDEAFETDTRAIKSLETKYKEESARLMQAVDALLLGLPEFLDTASLKAHRDSLAATMQLNSLTIGAKAGEPSRSFSIEPISETISGITTLIDAANTAGVEHNRIASNFTTERINLTAKVWRFVLDELQDHLSSYDQKLAELNKAVANLETQIQTKTKEIDNWTIEKRRLEKITTSTLPTISAINGLLKSFGFSGFALAAGADERTYKLVREDGSDAKHTLSEGERSFVTFLYFYHLLKGSDSESDVAVDKVVVIDDPVSSLDCDVLFIVSSLIKGLFDDVRNKRGHIKQLFVFTHNVYFHKEITYNSKRRDGKLREETFWVVRKLSTGSQVVRHESNPIRSTYEMLWAEVRNPGRSNLTIQNTLRRILEHYFKILGGVDPDTLCGMFAGKERSICNALFSWVNDGSHSAHEDIYLAIADEGVENFLKVFRAIFEKSGHPEHFKMMMGDSYSEMWPAIGEVAILSHAGEESVITSA